MLSDIDIARESASVSRNTVLGCMHALRARNFCFLSHFSAAALPASESCCKLLSYGNVKNTVHERCECVHVFPHLTRFGYITEEKAGRAPDFPDYKTVLRRHCVKI